MIGSLSQYRTLVFDCDGVILDSNGVKTEAFRIAATPYGVEAAQALVDYHVARGGISRYVKFRHFLDVIVPGRDGPSYDALLQAYANAVASGLACCAVADGLSVLRAQTSVARWLIVSGGDQKELHRIFATRGLDTLFDAGIFGSPDDKDTILARESAAGTITWPALFLGDSHLDYMAATRAGLDFVFVANWSEWQEGATLAAEGQLSLVPKLSALLNTRGDDGKVWG